MEQLQRQRDMYKLMAAQGTAVANGSSGQLALTNGEASTHANGIAQVCLSVVHV